MICRVIELSLVRILCWIVRFVSLVLVGQIDIRDFVPEPDHYVRFINSVFGTYNKLTSYNEQLIVVFTAAIKGKPKPQLLKGVSRDTYIVDVFYLYLITHIKWK